MANVGPALIIPFTVNTSGATVGQGNSPVIRLLYSTNDQTVGELRTWTNIEGSLRSYQVSRGHDAPMSETDPGTATFNLDNRTRTFDPLNNAAIRPFNKYWLYEEFDGSRQDIFIGYAQSYGQLWPEQGIDAVAVVTCADELTVLSMMGLPATNPPSESYSSLISSDNPDGFWDMNEDPTARNYQASPTIDPVTIDSGWTIKQAHVDPDRRGDLRTSLLKSKRRH